MDKKLTKGLQRVIDQMAKSEQTISRGYIMLAMGAVLGSECACGLFGYANAEGLWGLDKDPQEATRWYREMQKCACRDSTEDFRERGVAWLRFMYQIGCV